MGRLSSAQLQRCTYNVMQERGGSCTGSGHFYPVAVLGRSGRKHAVLIAHGGMCWTLRYAHNAHTAHACRLTQGVTMHMDPGVHGTMQAALVISNLLLLGR